MADTSIALAPSVANASGAATVTASAALFTTADVGRLVSILHRAGTQRAAATAYSVGQIFFAEYNQVPRLYRVVGAGTTQAANLAGTTPDYDLNAPNETGLHILDGTAVLRYLGPGRHVWGFARITGYTSSTQVSVSIDPRGVFANTYASLRWRMGEFSNARGWPIAGTFHKGRLWLGGTDTKPQSLWASQVSDFENFGPTEIDGSVLDTNAIALSLDDDQVNRVRWMLSAPRGLAVGVASGEFMVGPANRNAAMAPANVQADRQGDRGSDATATPQRTSGVILFPQRGGQRLRQLDYDFGADRFTTADLTALADDIADGGFLETAYGDVPEGYWYGLRADGRVAVLTFDPEQRLRAWTVDELGGDGVVESIACIPDPAGTGTDLYLSVARTVDEVTTRTIEVIRSPFRGDLDDQADGYFVDCGLTYDSATEANTIAGLDHLDGYSVAICADGSQRQDQTVAGGSVPVTGPAATVVHVGLRYRSTIVDLPPEAAAPPGSTAQGRLKRVVRAVLRLLDTAACEVGGKGNRSEVLAFRTLDDLTDTAVPLFTGDRDVTTFGSWNRDGQLEIGTDAPLPMTVLAIIKQVDSG